MGWHGGLQVRADRGNRRERTSEIYPPVGILPAMADNQWMTPERDFKRARRARRSDHRRIRPCGASWHGDPGVLVSEVEIGRMLWRERDRWDVGAGLSCDVTADNGPVRTKERYARRPSQSTHLLTVERECLGQGTCRDTVKARVTAAELIGLAGRHRSAGSHGRVRAAGRAKIGRRSRKPKDNYC